MNDLSTNVAAFCGILRRDYQFAIGPAETHDSLRALETIGLSDELRFRAALRLVCCGTREQTIVFERAFDEFFRTAGQGAAQPMSTARHTRPGHDKPASHAAERPAPRPHTSDDDALEGGGQAATRKAAANEPDNATAWQMLRARYSPADGSTQPPQICADDLDMLAAAGRIVASARLGRSRRWKSTARAGRFDLRRSIRASLQTGGDPVDLRFLGHPRRNPRFVVLIDGSRSMTDRTGAIVGFARALCQRSARAHVFCFSTQLHDVTRDLRAARGTDLQLSSLGAAWGGGTRIGASLEAFIAQHGARLVSQDTLVFIFSDGLDAGDIPQFERAMRSIDLRCAGIVWLNPYADAPGYVPSARAMRAALPFVTLLAAANDARGFTVVAQRLARNPRISRRG